MNRNEIQTVEEAKLEEQRLTKAIERERIISKIMTTENKSKEDVTYIYDNRERAHERDKIILQKLREEDRIRKKESKEPTHPAWMDHPHAGAK